MAFEICKIHLSSYFKELNISTAIHASTANCGTGCGLISDTQPELQGSTGSCQAVANDFTVEYFPDKPCDISINQCTPHIGNINVRLTACLNTIQKWQFLGICKYPPQAPLVAKLQEASLYHRTNVTDRHLGEHNPGGMQSPPVGKLSQPQKPWTSKGAHNTVHSYMCPISCDEYHKTMKLERCECCYRRKHVAAADRCLRLESGTPPPLTSRLSIAWVYVPRSSSVHVQRDLNRQI
ncbi:hypothetical protein N7519_000728 [Penicillium mononematosum]|uniref:uncharacterized protein n=1 Tax=Penicillium mononematosum TaxID=268346 RepID=UPI002548FBDC|nr:uncharacterized protein N7519_000728 [Penicillium mononematosum]KAJ6190707.1 hypothetical protein N7519_000728 [Penicillium mononematosum]